MPDTWSDWVALIGAIIGSITGIVGLIVAYATIHRDRADIRVQLNQRRYGFKAMLEHDYPSVQFGPHYADDASHEWFVLTAVNAGLRPVHIEKAVVTWVEPQGPGSSSWSIPCDVLLSEDRRRVSIAFTGEGDLGYELWLAQFVDDTGREYTVYGPKYSSALGRRKWQQQRDKMLAAERDAEKQNVTPPPQK
jgi:hypothetical protein